MPKDNQHSINTIASLCNSIVELEESRINKIIKKIDDFWEYISQFSKDDSLMSGFDVDQEGRKTIKRMYLDIFPDEEGIIDIYLKSKKIRNSYFYTQKIIRII